MTIRIGPGRVYVARMGSAVFVAPIPQPPTRRQRVEAWLRRVFRRPKRLSSQWVDIGYTTEGAP